MADPGPGFLVARRGHPELWRSLAGLYRRDLGLGPEAAAWAADLTLAGALVLGDHLAAVGGGPDALLAGDTALGLFRQVAVAVAEAMARAGLAPGRTPP